MKLICIFFFTISCFYNLRSQDQTSINHSEAAHETFAIFVTQYTPVDSLHSIQTNLSELGYNVLFEDIVLDSLGLLESMNCSFSDVCQDDWETNSPLNFKTSFKLGIIFLSTDCSQGAVQISINQPNGLLGIMFPQQKAPTHFWNLIGDVPNLAVDEFKANHIVWETE